MQKRDFIWLTRNTDIDNVCRSIDECASTDVVLKVFRSHNTKQVENIFASYTIQRYKDRDDFRYVEIKGFSLNDFSETAQGFNADIMYNFPDGKFYYVPANAKAYMRTFRRSSPQMLNNLSTRKKLDILFAINQECYVTQKVQEARDAKLDDNSDKLNALLQIRIPPEFMEDELRKIRLITEKIAKIPNIKQELTQFHALPPHKQKKLFAVVSEITSEYSNIKAPNLFLIDDKKVKDFRHADWVDADAFAFEKNIYINTDKLKNLSAIQCLSLAWHETNHITQSYADYSKYPIMEDILSHRLNYLNEFADVYIMHPQEKVNYALEKQFIEESVVRIGLAPDNRNFLPRQEYDVATQYMAKSMQRRY